MTPIQQPTSSASDAMPCSFSFLSVCSGIEAASVAWEPLGWKACAVAEIEKFPSAVLAHHWPETPNLGDMTKHNDWPDTLRPNLIVGGTPCQAFSLAGLRQGLADPRGNLTLVFLGILAQFRPRWVVWENVPGVLSDRTGAFGSFLGGLGELGYGFAYRVLDAQYYGVAQRRRRVFVVGYLGDWRRAAAVLFEPESLRGDSPPSRGERKAVAATIAARFGISRNNYEECCIPEVCGCLSDGAHNGGGLNGQDAYTGRILATYAAPAIGNIQESELAGCLTKNSGGGGETQNAAFISESPAAVRRLTPRECERLQGFPDDHTLIPWRGKTAPDGPRYKALGNSMAVPVMRWIGERISQMNA
jgi:DNA (cytosine-5)-methyltransferase 1